MGRISNQLMRLNVQGLGQGAHEKMTGSAVVRQDGFDFELGFGRKAFPVDSKRSDSFTIEAEKELFGLRWMLGDGTIESGCCEDFLFLDTETTGLGFSAGTFAFLVGLTYRSKGKWFGEQLLVQTPDQERDMLVYLARFLARFRGVVTYNGKSYDLPLLRTRARLHKVQMNESVVHIDLYHVLRAMLKDCLPRFRLKDLEVELLDFTRRGDISGDAIPAVYYAQLHGQDDGEMVRVIEHNQHDVRSMVELFGWLIHHSGSQDSFSDDEVEFGFLKRWFRASSGDVYLPRLNQLWLRSENPRVRVRLAMLVYQIFRSTDLHFAVNALRTQFDQARGHLRGEFALRLAIELEHRLNDLPSALTYAYEAASAEEGDGHQRRISRLRTKLSRMKLNTNPGLAPTFSQLWQLN